MMMVSSSPFEMIGVVSCKRNNLAIEVAFCDI